MDQFADEKWLIKHWDQDQPVRFRISELLILIACISAVLAVVRGCSCVPKDSVKAIKIGMTKDEVLSVMGVEPYKAERCGGPSQWTWDVLGDPWSVLVVNFGTDDRVTEAYVD